MALSNSNVVASVCTTCTNRSPVITFTSYTPQAGDWIGYWQQEAGTTATASGLPADWSSVTGSTSGISSGVHQEFAFFHIVTSAEATAVTTSWTLTNLYSANISGRYVACVVRGANVIDALGTNHFDTNTGSPTLAGLTGTDLSTGSLILSGIGCSTVGLYGSSTPPSGWTAVVANPNSGVTAVKLYTKDVLTTAGSDVTATTLSGPGAKHVSITLALLDPALAVNPGQFFAMW